MKRMDRHRSMNAALQLLFDSGELHAATLTLQTQEEAARAVRARASLPCVSNCFV